MELTLDQALIKGVEAHKAGKLQEADRYYTAILKAKPKHPDANHNMGVLAIGIGKVQESLPFFKTALEVNPSIAQFWLNYIDALIKLNRMDDAKAVFNQAKSKVVKGDGFDQIEKRLGLYSESKNGTKYRQESQVNTLDKLNLYQALKLAKKNLKNGLSEEAKGIYQNILKKFPKNKKALDGMKALSKKVISKSSDVKDPPQDQLKSLINLYTQGQFQKTLTQGSQLLKEFPNSIYLYNTIGATNQSLGKLDEAIEAYSKALSIKPNFAEAYYNMGNALKEYQKLDEAIKAFNKAISLKPDYADAYYNMGNALKDQGKLEEAIEAFKKALSLKPDFSKAYYNMGIALVGVIFKNPNKGLQKTISSLLDQKLYVRPMNICVAAISLLKVEPSLQKQLKLVNDGKVIQDPLNIISDLSELPLLLKLMSVCPLPDLELEKLFKQLRASILENISSFKEASPELLRFQSALALQCFTNEYIYSQNKDEEKAINDLEKQIKELLSNNEQPSPLAILILASYKALHKYDWCQSLIVTNQIQDVFTRQIEEPIQEEKLKLNLPILEEINNKVSSNVREQYEESPYPRWVNLGLRLEPAPISKIVEEVKLKLHDNKITEVKKPDILIAGCGTGQHSITSASRFKSSKVLAIDLSLSSLAYAKRKTEELSIENIKYMQADILDLGQLNKKFDIIECGGVLHHMDNPMEGWKVLTDCLKPGGLMMIGLYSELARQHIVKIIEEISQTGIGSSDVEMRSFRDMIIKSDKDHHKLIIESPAFYSLSTIKDLLFHVQEHRFTIPLIKDHLNKLGLKFCGFESSKIVSHFKLTNKNEEDPYNLDKWHVYEEANPSAFAGMYQFYCQKDN